MRAGVLACEGAVEIVPRSAGAPRVSAEAFEVVFDVTVAFMGITPTVS